MYDCEICGRKTETLYIVDVEGAELTSCAKCSEGKNIIDTIGAEEVKGAAKQRTPGTAVRDVAEEEVVDNFGEEIRKAREAQGLPLSVLAERINEKESTLNRVEHGRMLPPQALVKKLEKQLGIKLMAVPEQSQRQSGRKGQEPVTLGDAAERK
ncbi:MAG: multiprotein bridging factor aMBF1 [Candidatus Marsarchaeota archaeon]|jgi:uncharacterized protein (TIGR00270 family)|nr:multiprotein bridging factor aMBF1 [Candidatus Marsarchaeota archaeon]